MAEKDEEQPARSFKVADRRRFVDSDTSDTSAERDREAERERERNAEHEPPRAGIAPDGEQPASPAETAAADAAYRASAASSGEHPVHGEAPAEMSFSTFVIGLTTQALMHLGEIADPLQLETGRDLPAAKQMIDLLGILREKTKGNLDQAEEQLLDSMLYDLRMRFVEVARNR